MRSWKHTIALALGVLGAGLPPARGAGFDLFTDSWNDVIVATDMTAEGRKLTPPTAAQPVYYLGRSLGERLGEIGGDKLPDKKELDQIVAKVLAKQGYLGARPGGDDPALFLVVQWGYLTPGSADLYWFLGYNSDQDVASYNPSLRYFRSREIEMVLQCARLPLYGIIVTAFDFKSARTPRPVIYWQTRIGLPANGKWMKEALPVMLLAAGPAIGRESGKPVLVDADNVRQGHVTLGELQVLDVLETPADDPGVRK
jgi:hypothetical protein